MDDDRAAIFTVAEGYFGAKMGAQLLFQFQDFRCGGFAWFGCGLFATQFTDQLFGLADVQPLLDDGLQGGGLALFGGKCQQRTGMALGDLIIGQGLFDHGRQFKQAQGVGNCGAAFPYPVGDFFM